MSKCDIRPEFECQNSIIGPSSNVKIVFHVLKCDIRSQFECQNRNFECQIRYSASSNVKMGYSARNRMSNRISNVKMGYSARVRLSK